VAGARGGIAERSEMSGFRAATSTVTGSERTGAPPLCAASSSRWLPVGSGGGKTTNWPDSSASTLAITRPPSRSSTVVFGVVCPATTVSPVGSTRTTSNAGRSIVGSAAAGAVDTFGAESAFARSDFASILSLELEVVSGDIKGGDVSVGRAAIERSGRARAEVAGPGGESGSAPAVRIGAVCALGQLLASFRTRIGVATAAAATLMAPTPYQAFIHCIYAILSPLRTFLRGCVR
jgi:hypothetical protein